MRKMKKCPSLRRNMILTFMIVSLVFCSACGNSGGNSSDAEKNTMDVTVNAKGQEVQS